MNLVQIEKTEALADSAAWEFLMGFGVGLGIVAFFGC